MMTRKATEEPWNLAFFLCAVWIASLLYGEMFAFWVPIFSCSWPHLSASEQMSKIGLPGDYVKAAVIADPQLMDRTSLNLAPNSLLFELAQFYTDLFMRRAYLASISPFKPEIVLFLGDYFDGGPSLMDEGWEESLTRFRHIFNLNSQGRTGHVKIYYIPGNHDVGYATDLLRKPEVLSRYESEFGTRNHQFTIGTVDFIAIDAQTIDGSSKARSTLNTWDFVHTVSRGSNSRVLLTHIPLYRPDWTSCGSHRYSPIINQRIRRAPNDNEIAYQNYISEESSHRLLSLIQPVLVLSGHDHDQCIITHVTMNGPIRERTVGTVSWQQGNLYPSFMLMSVSNSAYSNASTQDSVVSTELCFLPQQTFIYIWYAILFVMTILALLFWPSSGIDFWYPLNGILRSWKALRGSRGFGIGLKEKNVDDNCEYQMVWDVEGSMHLVRIPLKPSSMGSKEMGSLERGYTLMRPTRRQTNLDQQETSLKIDMEVDVDSGSSTRLKRSRQSRSITRMVIQRIIRMVKMALFVALVNVTLYMMLLLKDWIY